MEQLISSTSESTGVLLLTWVGTNSISISEFHLRYICESRILRDRYGGLSRHNSLNSVVEFGKVYVAVYGS